MSPALAVPLFVASLVVTLGAAGLFAQRLDRLGTRFGFPEALVGLLTALAADGPELSAAIVALLHGAHDTSVGVLVGSNVFNLAAMLGFSAVLVGRVRLPRAALLFEGLIGAIVTGLAALVLLGWVSPLAAAILDACVLGPYLAALIRGPVMFGAGARLARSLSAALDRRAPPEARAGERPTHHLLALVVVDVTLIVAGSTGMVQACLALGDRWHVTRALLGVLILGPLTSLPNAFTGVRLGRAGRGSALVGETFNSNTINLAVGVVLTSLFVGVAAASRTAKLDLGWLVGMTAFALLMLSRPAGLRRAGGAVLILLYAGFVIAQLV